MKRTLFYISVLKDRLSRASERPSERGGRESPETALHSASCTFSAAKERETLKAWLGGARQPRSEISELEEIAGDDSVFLEMWLGRRSSRGRR